MQENNEMTALSVLKLFPENKTQINDFANQIAKKIINGEVDALEVYYFLKQFEIVSKKILENFNVKDILFDAIEKNNNQPYKGAESISIHSTTMYDFSHSVEWRRLESEKKNLEQLMKTIKEPMASEATGEIIEPAKIKSCSKYVKCNFKK